MHTSFGLIRHGDLNYHHRGALQPQWIRRFRPPPAPPVRAPESVRPSVQPSPLLRKLLPNDLFRAQDLEKRLSRHVPAPPAPLCAAPPRCHGMAWLTLLARSRLQMTNRREATSEPAMDQRQRPFTLCTEFLQSQVI